MANLKQALEKGRLKQFVKEREGMEGDPDAFDRTIEIMAGKSSKVRPASPQDASDD